ncbi:retrotransposon protein, putative, ty1-copia subclass [Tanacetum coccineum]
MNISDIQKNLYNTLIELYNSDKDLFASYGDVVTLKRGRDDQDKDEEPSAGSNRGTKRRRSGKEESSKEATQKESKSTSSSKGASISQPKSSGKSAQAEEHGPRVDDLEEPLHQEFSIGNDDVSHTVDDRPPQSWMTQLAQASGTQSSFNEFLATPIDFSAFTMNWLKLNNLTQDVLTGSTYGLMKGTCKSVVELEYHLEEVFKATNDLPISLASPTDSEYLRSGMRYMIHNEVACLMLGKSATRILNMVPTKKVDKTPYELWYGKVPNLSYLKVWGCEALVKRDTPDKLKQRSILKKFQEEEDTTTPSEITSNIPQEVEGFEPPQEEVIPIRRSERTHRAPNRLCLNVEVEEHSLGDLNEPTSYKAAMLDLESNKWIDAMNAEIQSMMDNMVWVLVDLPPGCKTVGSKWLFKKKTDMDGIVHVYKARLVAKGYTQLYGVDYEETFSPVADIRAIRILISIAAYYDYEIWQMDVKTTFLNGYLDEDIYMVQPEGFVDPNHPRKVCKLQRSIYGLKQASRSWNKRFDEEIKRFGFAQNLDEPCVYQKASGSNVTFLILYVDDIIIMGNHIPSLQSVKDYLGKCFAMKDLGEAAFILGIKIYRDRSKRLIGLSQNAYMDKILKRYKMDNSKRGHIPMQERLDLNQITRPDVASPRQNITSRFQQNPGELHWTAVKNILKTRYGKKMLCEPLCDGQPDSHEHLFFQCPFSHDIWSHMKGLAGLDRVAHDVYEIVDHLGSIAKKRSSHVVIAKLVVAASAYFIWQERNWRLFKKSKRSVHQVIECISSAVRLKLLSCSFKRTMEGVRYARLWDLPDSIFK